MIRVQNIYYMLSYAFEVLQKRDYVKVGTESFKNTGDLFSEILLIGIPKQIKQGLYKEYEQKTVQDSLIRGKIDITESIKRRTALKKQMICQLDELTINNLLNQILKTTMVFLLHADISSERKKKLRKLLLYFAEVTLLNPKDIDWHITFHRQNQEYRMLIGVCYLTMQGLLQTTREGQIRFMDFLDEQRMSHLYEKFLLGYFRKEHAKLQPRACHIPWNLDDDSAMFLPEMKSDVILTGETKQLVIDAKYYSTTTQSNYGVPKIHSHNLYQIYTYVKNLDRFHTGDVSGMLLYAKTDDDLLGSQEYFMDGNRIYVRTLDLNSDFSKIRKALEQITVLL